VIVAVVTIAGHPICNTLETQVKVALLADTAVVVLVGNEFAATVAIDAEGVGENEVLWTRKSGMAKALSQGNGGTIHNGIAVDKGTWHTSADSFDALDRRRVGLKGWDWLGQNGVEVRLGVGLEGGSNLLKSLDVVGMGLFQLFDVVEEV
jgi:hypothetical protein